MASQAEGVHENGTSPTSVENGQPPSTDDKTRIVRHPRWTRQETLFLIEGKKVAEDHGLNGRRSSSLFGPDPYKPKWDTVSSYCRQRGVNRGPVQCRKRWSNLICDYRKIKLWESQRKGETESFWTMRSDLRRDRRLPGFFDREVYDVLDGKMVVDDVDRLALVPVSLDEENGGGVDGVEVEVLEDEDEMVDDEEVEVGLNEDGPLQEFDQVAKDEVGESQGKEKATGDDKTKPIPSPVPISERRCQPHHDAYSNQGTERLKRPQTSFTQGGPMHREEVKRRRFSSDGCQNTDASDQLIIALQTHTNMLNDQLEAQNTNLQAHREQRNEQHKSLITALNKITDALSKIADKL